jgi:hypothetical protein
MSDQYSLTGMCRCQQQYIEDGVTRLEGKMWKHTGTGHVHVTDALSTFAERVNQHMAEERVPTTDLRKTMDQDKSCWLHIVFSC